MDFINTQIICSEQDVDLLTCMNDLHQWSSEIGVELDCISHEITIDKDVIESSYIEEVHRFRASLKTLIKKHQSMLLSNQSLSEQSVSEGMVDTCTVNENKDAEHALSMLNQYLCHAPSQQQLVGIDQQYSLQPLDKKLSIKQLLGKIALSAATLLTSAHGQHIKNCSNDKCILMFVDTSRSKKRRWCSMDRCGNRSKASKFYHANKAS